MSSSPDIDRDEVRSRGHEHHAQNREEDQRIEFPAGSLGLFEVADRCEHCQTCRDEEDDLEKQGEAVQDEHSGVGLDRIPAKARLEKGDGRGDDGDDGEPRGDMLLVRRHHEVDEKNQECSDADHEFRQEHPQVDLAQKFCKLHRSSAPRACCRSPRGPSRVPHHGVEPCPRLRERPPRGGRRRGPQAEAAAYRNRSDRPESRYG